MECSYIPISQSIMMYSILFSTRPWESNPNLTLILILCKRDIPRSINFFEGANYSPKETNHRSKGNNFMWRRSEGVNTNLRKLVLTRWGCNFKEFGAKLMI